MKKLIKNNLLLSISLALLLAVLAIIVITNIPNAEKQDYQDVKQQEKLPSELDEIGESGRYIKTKDTVCPEFEGVMYAYDGKFVTNIDNEYYLYEYVIEKKYSDETNCRVITKLDKKPILFTYQKPFNVLETYIVYEDLSFAPMRNPNTYAANTGVPENPYYYLIKWMYNTDEYRIKNKFDTGNGESTLVVKKYSISKPSCGDNCTIDNQFLNDVMDPLGGENMIKKYLDGAIITTHSIYTWGVTDDSCMTYADKECKKGFKRNMDLTERYDDIAFVDELYVVFKDGTTYLHYDN